MKLLFATLFSIFFTSVALSEASNRIEIVLPSVEQETQQVWQTLQDILFFDEHKYNPVLPEGELMELLLKKARSGKLTDADFDELGIWMKAEVYESDHYSKGFIKVAEQVALVNRLLLQLESKKWDWSFKTFPKYEVVLTLYGPGGSYDSDLGKAVLFTTPEGGFKNYINPANTILHEMIHMGIEDSIIQQYQVPHGAKEGIVDQMVLVLFSEFLPDYKLQSIGATKLVELLKTEADLLNLESIVADYMTASKSED